MNRPGFVDARPEVGEPGLRVFEQVADDEDGACDRGPLRRKADDGFGERHRETG